MKMKMYPAYRQNIKITKGKKWFAETFLPSFEDCDSRTVSEKQGRVFMENLVEEPENWGHANADYYSGVVNGREIRLQRSGAYAGCTKGHTKTLYRDVFVVYIRSNYEERVNRFNELDDEYERIDQLVDEMYDNDEPDEKIEPYEKRLEEIEKEKWSLFHC